MTPLSSSRVLGRYLAIGLAFLATVLLSVHVTRAAMPAGVGAQPSSPQQAAGSDCWSIVSVFGEGGRLNDVAVLSPGNVWTVGYTFAAGDAETVVLHWNGATWDRVPNPNTPYSPSYLYAVDAVSASGIWA